MPSVTNKPFMLSVIMLIVVMVNVVAPCLIIQGLLKGLNLLYNESA
jgi:hypothetical protein